MPLFTQVFNLVHCGIKNPLTIVRGKLFGRGEWIRTTGLYAPNVALCQAELHPGWGTKLPKIQPAVKADDKMEAG